MNRTLGDGSQTQKYMCPVRPDGEISKFMKYMKDDTTLVVDCFISYPHVSSYTYDLAEKKLIDSQHWSAKPDVQTILKNRNAMGQYYRTYADGTISIKYPSTETTFTWGPETQVECPAGYTPCSNYYGDDDELYRIVTDRYREARMKAFEELDIYDGTCDACGTDMSGSYQCPCDMDPDE